MPDTQHESEKIGTAALDGPLGWSEKILDSQKLANLAIIVLILLTALALGSIGFLTTVPFAPADAAQVPAEDVRAAGR